MKKTVCIMLSFVFIFTLTVFPVFANAENLTKEEIYFDEKLLIN